MRGLRKSEGDKFEKFFKKVQEEAKMKDAVFFLDCGQGKQYEDEEIECEDMWGWLIPEEMVSEFEPLFKEDSLEAPYLVAFHFLCNTLEVTQYV